MPFQIVRNDIVKMPVDAIVNAANSALQMGGGVCGAIFEAAGAEQLQSACDAIGNCHVGSAVITKGYGLPARHIIHTVGPIWHGGNANEAEHLTACYTNSLQLANENGIESIAFPLIASGIYGYPKEDALNIAISAIGKFVLKHDMMVYLVVYDKNSFVLSEKLYHSIEKYIEDGDVDDDQVDKRIYESALSKQYTQSNRPVRGKRSIHAERLEESIEFSYASKHSLSESDSKKTKRLLEDVVNQKDESFSQMLLRLIDEKGLTDVDTYKKANIDRRVFSKIRSDTYYSPSKPTALGFAIAMELSLDETIDLLGKAGLTLSPAITFDKIIRYYIEIKEYDIFKINASLFKFNQDTLGVNERNIS